MIKKLNVSILGDSISTYEGVSNNPNDNSTLLNNKVFYKEPIKVEDTWWYQVIKELDMKLLVNNSYSGSSVSDVRTDPLKGKTYATRVNSLHNNLEVNPDIILVYMGVNDLMDNASCNINFDDQYFNKIKNDSFIPTSRSFDESYALLMYRLVKNYPDAKIYSLNIPIMECNTKEDCNKYNDAIMKIANYFNNTVIDLYHSSISNYEKYTIDGVHPNTDGMKEMAKCVVEFLKK